MNNVVAFGATPRTIDENYKRHHIKITYTPDSKLWEWEFTHTQTSVFRGEALTKDAALKAAKKRVDALKGGRS